jgi:hypothetical protein
MYPPASSSNVRVRQELSPPLLVEAELDLGLRTVFAPEKDPERAVSATLLMFNAT